jgi:hypothetical protein
MAEHHRVVSSDEWIEARKQLLAKEKEFTRLRDQLSQQRRDLPWERVDKQYVFEGPNGRETLPELFEGRSQLIVYHFMFVPDWEAGCPHCSRWADNCATRTPRGPKARGGGAVQEMGGGPPGTALQGEVPNHRKLRRLNGRGGERCGKGVLKGVR